MSYRFRREDNGEIVEVDFATMMEMDSAGYITLPDGVVARRCRDDMTPPPSAETVKLLEKPVVSDALGFTELQFEEFEQDRVQHGFTGIEFRRDPDEPTFFQVVCHGKDEWRRYLKHRGYFDKNSANGSGAMFTPEQFEKIQAKVREKYPGEKILV